MSLIDWAKANPAMASTSGVVAAGALFAGVFFSGVLSPDETSPDPAPVAVEATASATQEPTVAPTGPAAPSTSTNTPVSSAAPTEPVAPSPSETSAAPTTEPTPSGTPAAGEKDLEDLGEHQQEPEANTNHKEIAEAFGAAYAQGGVGKAKWIKAMKPYTSPEFLSGFSGIDEQWIADDEFVSSMLTVDDGMRKVFELHFKSGLVEVVQLTLAEDYQTWQVSNFG